MKNESKKSYAKVYWVIAIILIVLLGGFLLFSKTNTYRTLLQKRDYDKGI